MEGYFIMSFQKIFLGVVCLYIAVGEGMVPIANCKLDSILTPVGPSHIRLTSSGTITPTIDDVALVLYATVCNYADEPVYGIFGKSIRCCLFIGQAQQHTDCHSMQLISNSIMSVPSCTCMNVSLIYPTMYPYDRSGFCQVLVTVSGAYHMMETIHFDTRLQSVTWVYSRVDDTVQGISSKTRCPSEDLDQYSNCKPTDCIMKYGGRKNFFNPSTMLCEEVVDCMPLESVPFRLYDPATNLCINQTNDLSAEDLMQLKSEADYMPPQEPESEKNSKKKPNQVTFQCVHGKPKANSKSCYCDPGWLPDSIEPQSPISNGVYYLCSIPRKMDVGDIASTRPIATFLVILIAVNIMMCMVLGLIYAFNLRRNKCSDEWMIIQRNSPFTAVQSRAITPALPANAGTSKVEDGDEMQRMSPSKFIYYCNRDPQLKDTSYARVHTPNQPLEPEELDLKIGDTIYFLEPTNRPDMWQGTCNGTRGFFPAACAEFRLGKKLAEEDIVQVT